VSASINMLGLARLSVFMASFPFPSQEAVQSTVCEHTINHTAFPEVPFLLKADAFQALPRVYVSGVDVRFDAVEVPLLANVEMRRPMAVKRRGRGSPWASVSIAMLCRLRKANILVTHRLEIRHRIEPSSLDVVARLLKCEEQHKQVAAA
jgi:hypothetical protein